MSDLSLDFRLFRYALAAAERGSFRRAAAALNVQHAAISKGVQILEHRVGAALFERSHAGVRPTSAGEEFLQEAALGFDHLERAMQRIGAARRGEHGELVVATSVPFFLLGDVFERFRDAHRGVAVEMAEGTCSASLMLVRQRKADVAFVAKTSTESAMQSLHLRDEHLVVVLPRSHRLARAQAVLPEELSTEAFVLAAGGLGPQVADHLRQNLEGEPILRLHKVGQCDVVNMVARGFGITVVVGHLRHPAPEGVVLIPMAGVNPLPIHAVWRTPNPDPALKALINIARRTSTERAQEKRARNT